MRKSLSFARLPRQLSLWVLFAVIAATASCGARPDSMAYRLQPVDLETDKVERLLNFCGRMHSAGDLSVAAGLCRRANVLAPDDPRPLVELGAIMLELDRHHDSIVAYRRALSLDATRLEALLGLGKAHLALKQYDEAERQFEIALRLDENDYRSYNGLGVLKDLRGNHAKAQSFYRTGLTLAPDAASLRSNLGLSLSLKGRHQEAVAILGDLARDYDSDATNRQNLALAYARAGDMRNAERIARLDLPADAVASNLDYFAAQRMAAVLSEKQAQPARPAIARPAAAAPAEAAEHGVPPVVLWPAHRAIFANPVALPASASPAQPKPVTNASMPVASTTPVDVDGVDIDTETAGSAIADAPEPVKASPIEMAERNTTTPAAARPAASGQFAVQLGSYRNLALAAAALAQKQRDLADVIGADSLKLSSVKKAGGSDVRYRLKVSGFTSRGKAAEVCAKVRKRGSACLVSAAPARRVAATEALPAAGHEAQSIDAKPLRAVSRGSDEGSSFSVQLGAFRHSASLEKELARLRRAAPDLLGRQKMQIQESTAGGRKILRLRTAFLADEKTARALCRSLKAAGIGCVVAKGG